MALEWEELRVPFTIAVPSMSTLYVENLRRELRDFAGFQWQNWNAAAQYCLQQNANLEEALTWADNAIGLQFVGQANFTTYSTKAQILAKLSRAAEATDGDGRRRWSCPMRTPVEIHQYGRQLQQQGKQAEAMAVFQKNAKRFGDAWPVHVGLARGYSAAGDYKAALTHAERALTQAPDALNRTSLDDRDRHAQGRQGHERAGSLNVLTSPAPGARRDSRRQRVAQVALELEAVLEQAEVGDERRRPDGVDLGDDRRRARRPASAASKAATNASSVRDLGGARHAGGGGHAGQVGAGAGGGGEAAHREQRLVVEDDVEQVGAAGSGRAWSARRGSSAPSRRRRRPPPARRAG